MSVPVFSFARSPARLRPVESDGANRRIASVEASIGVQLRARFAVHPKP